MESIFRLENLNVKDKKVLLRADLNTPIDKKTYEILDDSRLMATIPTLEFLIKNKAITIIICHFGRPEGRHIKELSTVKIAKRLEKLLKKKVHHLDDCVGNKVKEFINNMKPGEVVLLENLRFYKEEKDNDKEFSRKLSELADIYVNDAFGAAHRAHASVVGVTEYLKSAAGFLLEEEIDTMGQALENPRRPFVAIMGGLKVSDKIKAIDNLLKKVDYLLIVGAKAFTFIKARGFSVGNSFVEEDSVGTAKRLLKNKKIVLPVDTVVGERFDPKTKKKIVLSTEIPDGWEGLDIGPETAAQYFPIIKKAKTVIWNGTAGVAEWPRFAEGSKEIAYAIADVKGTTIVGGGETAALVKSLNLQDKISHVSTGGGASLEFLEGKKLPAIAALEENYKRFK